MPREQEVHEPAVAVFRVVVAWLALVGLWLLYVGVHTKTEAVAGAIAATLSLGLALVLRRLGLLRFGLDRRWLVRAARIPWYLLRDFGLITLALLRGRPEGAWATMEFPVGGDDPVSAGRRALVGVLGTIAPNAYVVDFDRERGVVLVHQLDPRHARSEPL
jgi:multisubunit Na+/H+ antiporter MnhE subunit